MSIIRQTRAYMDAYERRMEFEEMEREEAAELALGNSAKLTLEESQRLLMTEEELEDIRRQWEEDNDEKAVSRRVRDEVFAASRHWRMEDELPGRSPMWVLPEYCRAMAPNLRTDGDWEPEPFYAMPVAKQPPSKLAKLIAAGRIAHFVSWRLRMFKSMFPPGIPDEAWVGYESPYGPYQPTEWDVDLPYVPELSE
jgi:hypothetical protein